MVAFPLLVFVIKKTVADPFTVEMGADWPTIVGEIGLKNPRSVSSTENVTTDPFMGMVPFNIVTVI